ncbi:MAG TPA: aconitase/3-isopropylmalate dehydratase large subunit family protein [Xanthobacteraceae bacterium]|jgi:3-isopropylmalate/(R)-2-methylmalate dehydratase large subunit|nr:aconitase/3-isopropylmalate dehydratase large subunit family protein [Xanthobacteraceae bacterium]
MHAISKIIAYHADRTSVEVGEIVNVAPDYVMLNDRGAARAAELLRRMGGDKVFDPERIVVVFDHHYPAIRPQDAVSQKKTREWIKEQGISKFHAGEGIGHVIFPEKGYAFPGALIFGTDSHTVTNSALGCVATGMGHSDIASYLALGYNWLRVPEVIRFDLHGDFRPGVYAKDIALRIAQLYGEDAAPYLGVEFAGPLTAKMAMSERLVLCNMVIDFGAKTGYIQPDEITAHYLSQRAPDRRWTAFTSDSDADYGSIVELDVSEIEPLVAVPHDLSDVRDASKLNDVRIDEAVFGTCTGGRIEDFRVAAAIMKGRTLAPHTRMMVNPGSREVYMQAMREGLIDIMMQAGAQVGITGCGPCSGCHQGMLAPAENSITNASRNFRGRFGSPEANIYVASSATVAASAIAGHIVSPAESMSD